MQIHGRFPILLRAREDSRGCEGVQNASIQIKEETSRSYVSRNEDLRDLTETVSIRKVVLAISRVTGCPPNELLNKRRSHLTQPFRTLLYLICREKTWQPFTEIGNALNRDHTTIVQGAKRGKLLIKKSRKMRKIYDEVIKELDVA
tara:strand:- start:1638 stop:2075 length:438 start_codon:yes stop_codon:yes gene_type:complete